MHKNCAGGTPSFSNLDLQMQPVILDFPKPDPEIIWL